ncbi:uncharacterized protein LOC126582911 isoform X1 [Malus sylvestris]|uniref:uncharacterized protein LOC126582911 isoform X1 n=2 Tax=Malus sylvestris TaxID=3752 RepID=UPI0021AC665C|nr:uncharacterized protein LOC126582911 isoform X1 [Malus sylvestris]
MTSMKKSPVHPKYEMDHGHSNGFDPHTDFYQFLEEAKHYSIEGDVQASSEEGGERRLGQEKKKKSWKKLIFPWLKGEKLNKTTTKPATTSHVSNTKRTNVSGPVYGTGKATDGKHRRQMSGPIASLFNPTKRADNAMPYMCVNKNGSPQVGKTYGPVYLVT